MRLFIFTEYLWVIKLSKLSLIEYKHFITIYNRVDSMRDGEHSRVFESLLDNALNLLFCYDIDVGSCLVQYDDAILTKYSPADAKQLFLAGA